MSKGYISNEDFEKNGFKKIHIKTKPFYRRNCGMISINNDVLLRQETDKAILIRERIQTDKEMYSTTSIWISKSKIIRRSD